MMPIGFTDRATSALMGEGEVLDDRRVVLSSKSVSFWGPGVVRIATSDATFYADRLMIYSDRLDGQDVLRVVGRLGRMPSGSVAVRFQGAPEVRP